MESTIVFCVETSRAYRFENGTMTDLGSAVTVRNLWHNVVFQIGERLFICEDENYRRIASNSNLIEFAEPENSILPQIRKISEGYLFYEGCNVITLSEALGKTIFEANESFCNLQNDNAFIIDADREFRLFINDEKHIPRLAKTSPVASESAKSFIWCGCGYLLKDGKFNFTQLRILQIFDNYALVMVDKDVFVWYENGNLVPLGSHPVIHSRGEHTLMMVKVETGTLCVQLHSDTFKRICMRSDETKSMLELDGNGILHLYYESGAPDEEKERCHRMFAPDSDGNYVQVK